MSDRRNELSLHLLTVKPDARPSSVPFDRSPEPDSSSREGLENRIRELEARNRELLTRLGEREVIARELLRQNAELIRREDKHTREYARACRQLGEWQQKYRDWSQWTKHARIGVLVFDFKLRLRQFNPQITLEIPLAAEDIGRPLGELADKFALDGLCADIAWAAENRVPLEREISSRSGRWYSLVIYPSGPGEERLRGLQVTLTEITEFRQATAELRKLSYAIEQNHSIIAITDPAGRIEYVNQKFTEHTGYLPEEVRGLDIDQLHPPEIDGVSFQEIWEQVKSGNRWAGEIEMGTRDGEWYWEGATMLPIKNPQGDIIHVLKMSQNITEHKTAEELLRKSEMLSAIGQLAAGVAHEIRNPLTALKGFTKLLERSMTNKAYTMIMMGELERIETIINEFLVLAKPQVWSFQKKQVDEILQDVLMLLEPEAHMGNVQFVTRFAPGLHPVSCVENQLKQVFLNILKNSLEAVPVGGMIHVETGSEPDGDIWVRIADNGCGIPEEKLARLGEPFYSTKEKGTGLGLMVSFKIIENHRGTYSVKSEPGNGTVVEIRLPAERENRV
ncbi:ATP-binding protein [Gorillibacterium sp. sgz500922]|uniref:ATP-binding protein n=1 Tax=Gorillibacterium sp. sgz500922 TaxID=3446694 RepID=UPI003F67B6A9